MIKALPGRVRRDGCYDGLWPRPRTRLLVANVPAHRASSAGDRWAYRAPAPRRRGGSTSDGNVVPPAGRRRTSLGARAVQPSLLQRADGMRRRRRRGAAQSSGLRQWYAEAQGGRRRRTQANRTKDADELPGSPRRADEERDASAAAAGSAPFEVESALLEHPAVAESAVIGKAHPDRGEIVKAFIVLRPGYDACERTRSRVAEAREGRDGALQIPTRARVRRRAAEDEQRQDPPRRAETRRSRTPIRRHNEGVSQTIEAPVEVRLPDEDNEHDHDRPWIVIVWNDPINLMSYVTFVLRKLFGFSEEEATKLMLQVHNDGKAVVSSGEKEKAEFDVAPPARPRALGNAQAGLMANRQHQARPQGRLHAAPAAPRSASCSARCRRSSARCCRPTTRACGGSSRPPTPTTTMRTTSSSG